MSKRVTYDSDKGGYQTKVLIKSIAIYIVLIILTLICLVPIYILFVQASRTSTESLSGFTLIPGGSLMDNWKKLNSISAYHMYKPFVGMKNSMIIALSCAALTVFFSGMTAYGLVVYDFKLKGPAFVFIIAVMMIPSQVSSLGFTSMLVKLGKFGIGSYVPLIVPAIAAPAIVFFMRQYMLSSFPLDIIEAARIDGSGEFRTFLTISIPMMKPAFAVQAIFAFIQKWNDYYTQSLVIMGDDEDKMTLPLMVGAVQSIRNDRDYGVNNFAVFFSIIPVAVVYIILSRFIIGGVAAGGVKE
jgi:multiple sugar transport system permease protein